MSLLRDANEIDSSEDEDNKYNPNYYKIEKKVRYNH